MHVRRGDRDVAQARRAELAAIAFVAGELDDARRIGRVGALDRWTFATRLERLVPDHRLEGTGTALLAREGGLAGAGPVSRVSAAVLHELTDTLQLSIEAGHERFEEGGGSRSWG